MVHGKRRTHSREWSEVPRYGFVARTYTGCRDAIPRLPRTRSRCEVSDRSSWVERANREGELALLPDPHHYCSNRADPNRGQRDSFVRARVIAFAISKSASSIELNFASELPVVVAFAGGCTREGKADI